MELTKYQESQIEKITGYKKVGLHFKKVDKRMREYILFFVWIGRSWKVTHMYKDDNGKLQSTGILVKWFRPLADVLDGK